MTTPQPHTPSSSGLFSSRRGGIWVAAAVLAGVFTVGAVQFARAEPAPAEVRGTHAQRDRPGGARHREGVDTSRSTRSDHPQGSWADRAEICDATASTEPTSDIPTEGPDAMWVLMDGHAVPQAPHSYGPNVTVDGVGMCFEHSPTGALFAALNAAGQLSRTNVTPELVYTLTTGKIGQQVRIANLAAKNAKEQHAVDHQIRCQLAAFRFESFTATEAVISTAMDCPNIPAGMFATSQVTTQWINSDWRISLAPNGSTADAVSTTNTLSGWTTWHAT